MTPRAPRLLLVEFVHEDPLRQQRSEYFPFVQGLARSSGIATDWVAVAAGRDERPNHPYCVEPSDALSDRLLDAARTFGPATVLVNERVGDRFADALRAAVPGVRLVQPPCALTGSSAMDAVRRELDLDPADASATVRDRSYVDQVVPDYARRVLGEGALAKNPFVTIWIEPRCLYARPVTGNPFFEGVAVDGLAFGAGCSFCVCSVPKRPPTPAQAIERVLLQLRRYFETTDPGLRTDRFLMFVVPVFGRMDAFLEGLLDLGLPASQFHLTCRIDELLRMRDALRRRLPALAAAGHSLLFWQIGLENLSADENLRLNKGVSPAQIAEAVAFIREQEAAWPRTFLFRRQSGFTMITFTPWTRLEDLKTNAAEVRRLGLLEHGMSLSQRLQLRAGTPLEALAERDGLIARDAAGARPFDAICITHWGESEIPWRFRHDDVATVHAVMSRLFPTDTLDGTGELGGRARALVEAHHPLCREGAVTLELLVSLVEQEPDIAPLALLERAVERTGPAPVHGSQGGAPIWARRLCTLLARVGAATPDVFGALRIVRAEARTDEGGGGFVEIELGGADERLAIQVRPDVPGGRAYARAGAFALSHAADTPVTGGARTFAFQRLAALLAGASDRILRA